MYCLWLWNQPELHSQDERLCATFTTLELYIRMLDAEGYPKAFISLGDLKFEFTKASLNLDSVNANVKITRETVNE